MSVRSIEYNDEAELRRLLVGHRIIGVNQGEAKEYEYATPMPSIQFHLDNGITVEAVETDGGCACSNGCWSVENPESTDQIITNVEFEERSKYEGQEYDYYEPGYSGEAVMKLFIYADRIKTELIRSEGGDNGYYGWGYHVLVHEVR